LNKIKNSNFKEINIREELTLFTIEINCAIEYSIYIINHIRKRKYKSSYFDEFKVAINNIINSYKINLALKELYFKI